MKRRIIYFKILSLTPIVNLFLFITLLLRAYMTVGHMPVYGNPDPKVFKLHYLLYMCSFLLLMRIKG